VGRLMEATAGVAVESLIAVMIGDAATLA
jgi:hypothetical protein